ISIVFHAALLVLAARARPPATGKRAPSPVEVTVLTPPRARVATAPAPEPPHAPARLENAPARTPASPTRSPEPPPSSAKRPLATDVELGNEAAPSATGLAVPSRRSAAPSPPVQKDLAANKGSGGDESCSEPPTRPIPRSKPSLIEYTPKARAEGIE